MAGIEHMDTVLLFLLRKLGSRCFGIFFGLLQLLYISNKYTQTQTYILPKTTSFTYFPTFTGLEACHAERNVHPVFTTVLKASTEEYSL